MHQEERQPLLPGPSHAPAPYSSTSAHSSRQKAPPKIVTHALNPPPPATTADERHGTGKDATANRSWCRSIFKFFQGLGKFFLILALGTVILVIVLEYTLPSLEECVASFAMIHRDPWICVKCLRLLTTSFFLFQLCSLREDRKNLHFPRSLEDLEALRKILSVYMDMHYYRVVFGFLTIYV